MLQHTGVPYEILPDYAEGTNRLALALETALPSKDIESNYEWNYSIWYYMKYNGMVYVSWILVVSWLVIRVQALSKW